MSVTPSLQLQDATVLLCGASGCLGTALAGRLAERGAVVTALGRDAGRLEGVPAARRIAEPDLLADGVLESAVRAAVGDGDGLDVVINAAGVVAFGAVTEVGPDVLRALLDVNALLPMLLARAAMAHLRRGGAFVNLTGIIAEPGKAMAGMSAYAASKTAVRAFDEVFAREARRAGVRVLDARPPHTETGLATRALAGQAPVFPHGLEPAVVARVVVDALESGARELPSEAFLTA